MAFARRPQSSRLQTLGQATDISGGFDIALRRVPKGLVVGCCSAGVNPRQGSIRHTPLVASNFRMVASLDRKRLGQTVYVLQHISNAQWE
jgi:hypothetical protein